MCNLSRLTASLLLVALAFTSCGGGETGQIRGLNLDSTNAVVVTLAGAAALSGSVDGTGAAARFYNPAGIITDGTNLFVADMLNSTIRKIVLATGAVTTLAGSAGLNGATDGTGAAARFNNPHGITLDGTNLYVADSGNSTIRKVEILTGVVTTLAGSAGLNGAADGTGAAARFNNLHGITTDGTNLYVTDTDNCTIRKIVIATGSVTTVAGSAGLHGASDGTGMAARFNTPSGMTTDGANLYVADTYNNTIRIIVIATGDVTTLAGSAELSGSTDGASTSALFYHPHGMTTDMVNLYVADALNHTIRKIALASGDVTTLAGSAGLSGSTDGTGTAARFNVPSGMTTDGISIYVADMNNDTIRKISGHGDSP